jgi:hypothetical protein
MTTELQAICNICKEWLDYKKQMVALLNFLSAPTSTTMNNEVLELRYIKFCKKTDYDNSE